MRVLSAAAVALACTTLAGAFTAPSVRVGGPSPLSKNALAPVSFRPVSMVATGGDIETDTAQTPEVVTNLVATAAPPPPFGKVMAANRAEIAVRIVRACIELNMATGKYLPEFGKYVRVQTNTAEKREGFRWGKEGENDTKVAKCNCICKCIGQHSTDMTDI